MSEPIIPFIPNFIAGKNTSHAKMLTLIGMRDHVNVLETIKFTRDTTMIANRRKKEKTAAQIFWVILILPIAVDTCFHICLFRIIFFAI